MRKEFLYGKKIKELRERLAWTQEQLATAARVEPRTVQRVEKDLTKNPETLQAIAGAFDVELDTIRITRMFADSKLLHAWLVTGIRQFVRVQEAHPWQSCYRSVIAPLTEEGQDEVDELLKRIFCDREYIEPHETELWDCYIQQIQEPLQSLFDLGLAIFVLDETRDLLLPSGGDMKPLKEYIDNWRVQHLLVIPRHGCFRLGESEPLHLFNDSCETGLNALFRTAKRQTHGTQVYSNALWAALKPGGEDSVCWCDTCFPSLPGGGRVTFEYIERVTGWNRAQLHALCDAITGQPYLEGLA